MLQLLAEMELLTGCTKSDFLQNWDESKSQLKHNVKQLLRGKDNTKEYEIPGNRYFGSQYIHYKVLCYKL